MAALINEKKPGPDAPMIVPPVSSRARRGTSQRKAATQPPPERRDAPIPVAPKDLSQLSGTSPFRPPDWRYRLAIYAIDAGAASVEPLFDDDVRSLHQTLAAIRADPDASLPPDERRAWDLFLSSRSPRIVLEARLLSRASLTEVAGKVMLSERTIELFERWFFNVRDGLEPSYVQAHVLKMHPPEPTLENVMRAMGFCRGASYLDWALDLLSADGVNIDLDRLKSTEEDILALRANWLGFLANPETDEGKIALIELGLELDRAEDSGASELEMVNLQLCSFQRIFPRKTVKKNHLLRALLGPKEGRSQ
jgi:hypothetical protein